MPTQIHRPAMSSRERYFARQSVYNLAKRTRVPEVLRAPWLGWVPDLPPDIAGWRGYRDGYGLIALPWNKRGIFLRHDDGYERVDPTNLPLGRGAAGPPSEVTGQFGVTMLAQYYDAAGGPNRIAVVHGEETQPVYCSLHRMDPTTGAWASMLFSDTSAPPARGTELIADREAIYDYCAFPFGAPTRNKSNAADRIGTLQTRVPCLVFCNADEFGPVDNVMVTPSWDAVPALNPRYYDELILWAGQDPGPGFKAVSCESFNGRVHFLNTVETDSVLGVITRESRHRWTAIGTADPDAAYVGSGFLDLAEFHYGRRIESMQDKLVLYFDDGVVFQVPTGFYADAYRPQVVSRSRGLIAQRALCAITPHLHFGIFNDGWFSLDSSGRWAKLGRIVLEESSGKSTEYMKWEETFYQELDWEVKHRTICTYDRYREIVRIAYPSKNRIHSENYEILNYHPATDTAWKDHYSTPTTSWGKFDVQLTVGLIWNTTTGTWDAQTGSWDSTAAQYQEGNVVHGNAPTMPSVWPWALAGLGTAYTNDGGLVFSRDPGLLTYDGTYPSYGLETHQINRNQNPNYRQTFHRFGVEYINIGGSAVQVIVDTDELGVFQTEFIPMSDGSYETLQNGYAFFRVDGAEHKFTLLGTAPVLIRSLVPELLLYTGHDREGQL